MNESRVKLAMAFLSMRTYELTKDQIEEYQKRVCDRPDEDFSGTGWSVYNEELANVINSNEYELTRNKCEDCVGMLDQTGICYCNINNSN